MAEIRTTAYVINLDNDLDRMHRLAMSISDIGFILRRIGGVRAKYLPNSVVKFIPGASSTERGTLGCFMSHLAAWEAINAGDSDFGLVLEDDARFHGCVTPDLSRLLSAEYDLVFCNNRLQPIKDIDGAGTAPLKEAGAPAEYKIIPLHEAVVRRPQDQKAPGGDGYLLTKRGAKRLMEGVAVHGIYGDVDWFLLSCGVRQEEFAKLPGSSNFRRKIQLFRNHYKELPELVAGVLTPHIVVHPGGVSSRLGDNIDHSRLHQPQQVQPTPEKAEAQAAAK